MMIMMGMTDAERLFKGHHLNVIDDKLGVLSHVLQETTRRADHDVAGADAIPFILQVLPPCERERQTLMYKLMQTVIIFFSSSHI